MAATAFDVAALFAIGLGLVFWLTDRGSPTSRALALFLVALGASIAVNSRAPEALLPHAVPLWARFLGWTEALAFFAGAEWGLRVGRTVATGEARRVGGVLVRGAQALAVLYALLGSAWPTLREQAFMSGLAGDAAPGPGFYLFAAPLFAAGALLIAGGTLFARQRPDPAERARIRAMLVAMPFLGAGLILPQDIAPYSLAVGEVVFLIGALRYYMLQGARAQLLGGFVAPQVMQLVKSRGVARAMQTQRATISVVACDLRGFTRHAAGVPPEQVLQLLRDYYRAVGAIAVAHEATVKDLAGDGVLMIVGAPLPLADHAARALRLARALIAAVRPMFAQRGLNIGLGVGVATGDVALGVIGEGARLEYAAVGTPVNLASRLCEEARDGEIRVDDATLAAAGETLPENRVEAHLKGLPGPVQVNVFATG